MPYTSIPHIIITLTLLFANSLTSSLVGLDAAEKQFGGGKVDPAKMRGTNEKITDQATSMFEKATGYVCVWRFFHEYFEVRDMLMTGYGG